MALAVTHVIGTIFLLDVLRHYIFKKEKFPRYLVVIGGIAGLGPDIDVPIGWILSLITQTKVNIHGLFTHSIFLALLLVIIGIIFHIKDNIKWARIFYVIAAGWFLHLSLDCLFNSYATFLWPITFDTNNFCPSGLGKMYRSGIDAIILVTWLVHEELHNC